ncbi:MAG: hypothetical protein ACI9MR_004686 [Myxococcota bacterium]|jgi:hypothetical protein
MPRAEIKGDAAMMLRWVLLPGVMLALATPAGCDDSATGGVDDTASDTGTEVDTADTASPDTTTADTTPVDTTPADTTPTSVGNPIGTKHSFTLAPFTVPAGTERQVCRTINLPIDTPIDVVRIAATMDGRSHHFNLYKVIDDRKFEPVSDAETTVHNCDPADEQLSGDAAYIYGSALPQRTFDTPEGIAFRLEPGQRLILEQHIINYTDAPMEGGVALDLYDAGDTAQIEHLSDIIWFANWGFGLMEPGKEHSDDASCTVPYDVEIFGMMSHFHALGILFEVDLVRTDGTIERVYSDDDWAHPTYQEYDPPLILRAGESVRWKCTWDNVGSTWIGAGKNSTDEMCMVFIAAYPMNTMAGDPIQCNTLF